MHASVWDAEINWSSAVFSCNSRWTNFSADHGLFEVRHHKIQATNKTVPFQEQTLGLLPCYWGCFSVESQCGGGANYSSPRGVSVEHIKKKIVSGSVQWGRWNTSMYEACDFLLPVGGVMTITKYLLMAVFRPILSTTIEHLVVIQTCIRELNTTSCFLSLPVTPWHQNYAVCFVTFCQ